MSQVKAQLLEDIKQAMRDRHQPKVDILRLLSAKIKEKEKNEQILLEDAQIFPLISTLIKQCQEELGHAQQAHRNELSAKLSNEISLLQKYLPEQLTLEAIEKLMEETLRELDPQGPQDLNKILPIIKEKVLYRADLATVVNLLKTKLASL